MVRDFSRRSSNVSDDPHVLDLSNRGLKKLERRDGVGVEKLSLDHNELSKLENIDCFLDVQKLSASHNQVTRMYSLARLSQLSSLDLSNNLIVCIEALKDLKYLVSVNLSNNKIKSLQNIQYSTTLVYLDLSGNSIPSLIDLTSLARLKTLLLKRNEITTLQKAQAYLPSGLCVFSVAENKITDLTEVSFLSHLSSLESFSLSGNPCVNMTGGIVGFDYRPYVINWCLGLRVLDDFVVTQRESLKAEWLYSQGKGRCFHLGDHLALVEYLSQVCPLTAADQMESEDEERISRILRMQRQHREQLLHEMSPAVAAQENNNAASRHGTPPSGNRRPKSAVGRLPSSRHARERWSDFSASEDERGSVYDPFPDLLAHSDEGPSRPQQTQQGQLSDACELLGAELLTRSVLDPRGPPIEKASDSNERSRQRRSRKDDIMTRSVPEFRSDGSPILHSYGKSSYGRSSPRAIPVRKVSSSKRSAAEAPPVAVGASAVAAGMSLTRSFEGTPQPSPSAGARLHQRSPSDGGLSRSFRTPSGRSPYATVATASPRKTQRSSSVSSGCPPYASSPRKAPSRTPSAKYPSAGGAYFLPSQGPVPGSLHQQNVNNNNNSSSSSSSSSALLLSLVESDPLLKQRSQAVGLELLERAAVRIQALWRGYRARAHMHPVHAACQEVRLRRLEEGLLDIRQALAATSQALLRQQKELEEERKCRDANKEALDRLLRNMDQLEGHISKVFQQQLLLQQQLSLHSDAVFKPICDEAPSGPSSSSSSEATVGNSVSTCSSATDHSPAKAGVVPPRRAASVERRGDLPEPIVPAKQEESSPDSAHEQTSGDAASADDTSCMSLSEAEPAQQDSQQAKGDNAQVACLTAVNDRLARLEAIIMKLASPENSLGYTGATSAKP